MYAALWRVIPGPWWLRVILLLIAAAAILYGLFFYVFPWVSLQLDPGEIVVE